MCNSAHRPSVDFQSNGLSAARTGLQVNEITGRNVLKPPTTRKAMAGPQEKPGHWVKDS